MILISYNSSNLSNNNKVKFYYALKGRDGLSGIIKHYDILFLGKGVLLLSYQYLNDIRNFLKIWNLSYKIIEISMFKGEEVFKNEI